MKIIIIKLSGKALNEFTSNEEYANMLKKIGGIYDGVILVHGAGKLISEWSEKLNVKSEFIEGQRRTTPEVMEVVAAVQSGLTNAKITSYLSSKNFNVTGLTGIDRNLFVAEYINDKLGYVGIPKPNGNINWLKELLADKVIPVFSSVCRDKVGNLMNVNADVFTKELAILVKAHTVLFVSDVEAININGKNLNEISSKEILQGIKNGHISGGMIPKLESSLELLNNTIKKIWVGNSLPAFEFNSKELHNKYGTWIIKSNKVIFGQ